MAVMKRSWLPSSPSSLREASISSRCRSDHSGAPYCMATLSGDSSKPVCTVQSAGSGQRHASTSSCTGTGVPPTVSVPS